MPIELKPGTRLRSAVDETEVVVVRAPTSDVEITCGGHPMVDIAVQPPSEKSDPAWSDGTRLGKRYGSDELGIELLCTRPGTGSLGVDGVPLEPAQVKPLPASD